MRPDGKNIFQNLATYTNENLPKIIKNAKEGSIISPMQNEGFKNCQRLLKFGKSGNFFVKSVHTG